MQAANWRGETIIKDYKPSKQTVLCMIIAHNKTNKRNEDITQQTSTHFLRDVMTFIEKKMKSTRASKKNSDVFFPFLF